MACFIFLCKVTEIKIEKRITESFPKEFKVDTVSACGTYPKSSHNGFLTFKTFERGFGSSCEVPLNPRSLYDQPRNTVSMQTVDNFHDETSRAINTNPSEFVREVIGASQVKHAKNINPIATLPRHSAAVNAIGAEDRQERNGISQSFLELDVLPS